MNDDFVVLDLFSGPGGLLEGFSRENFLSLAHVEMDRYAAQTLETRLMYNLLKNNKKESIYLEYLKGDISRDELVSYSNSLEKNISERTIKSEINLNTKNLIKKQIENLKVNKDLKKIDVVLGGPPCQSYSLVGRNRISDRIKNDPRNNLYKIFLDFVNFFKPDIFVFENVPGILSALNNMVLSDFQRISSKYGYNIKFQTLDSSNFLVLQKRKRVIILGWKEDLNFEYPVFQRIEHNYKVWDLLNDLPKIEPGEGCEYQEEYLNPPSKYLIQTKIRKSNDVLIQHNARTHNNRDREIYRRTIDTWNTQKKRLKYNELPKTLITHKNTTSFLDRYKVVVGDGLFSHCIVSHISKDGHYYIHPDINQARSLTVREAARIQSFPDNYKFEGPRTAQFRQVGNAVPPLMAREIAKEVRKMLEEI